MNAFTKEETQNTPKINFDIQKNIFEISGKSFPEDSQGFYQQLLTWMDETANAFPDIFSVNFNFYYISSSSIIAIKKLLLKLKHQESVGKKITIFWHYDEDDDDIKRTGEDYEKVAGMNFSFVANKE
ncbi:MAG: SiaC family regulatory phosphoprotein [Bacteroidia bacterium]